MKLPPEMLMPYIGEVQEPNTVVDAINDTFRRLLNNEFIVSSSYDPVTRVADILLIKTIDTINISMTITKDGAITLNNAHTGSSSQLSH